MAAWFRPRRYGYGASPASWQGWLLVAADIAIVLGAMWVFLPHQGPLPLTNLAEWAVVAVGATAATVWISYRTTDGAWRWRWGDRHHGTH